MRLPPILLPTLGNRHLLGLNACHYPHKAGDAGFVHRAAELEVAVIDSCGSARGMQSPSSKRQHKPNVRSHQLLVLLRTATEVFNERDAVA